MFDCKKMEIHNFKILLILLGLSSLAAARPTQLDENNSDVGDSDYGSNDDGAAEEYIQGDEAVDEAPQNRNDVPEGQELHHNLRIVPDRRRSRNRYQESSGKSNPDRQRRFETIANMERLKSDTDNDESGEEVDSEKIIKDSDHYKKNRELGDTNIKEKSFTADYVGEPLFKIRQDGYNTDRIEYINDQGQREQLRRIKDTQNPYKTGSRDFRSREYDQVNRNRRQASNVEVTDDNSTPSQKKDIDSKSENSESSIVKNIKKLSEQDLEELLNSLPEDKKAILKKIMEKREITKKAGAVEETFLEGGQSDSSKNDGGFLLDSSTILDPTFSSSTDTTDINKHTDNGEADNTKNAENENVPVKTEEKSLIFNSKDPNSNVGIESAISNGYSDDNLKDEQYMKSENKREINKVDYTNEDEKLENSANNGDSMGLKDELNFENEDFLEQKGDEIKANTNKRDINAENPVEMPNSIQSLEESFPSDSAAESLSPLIRVKRTEKDHSCNKRDTNIPSNLKVPYSPGVESGGTENDERSEIEDYGFLDRASNYERDNENSKIEDKISHDSSRIYERDLKFNPIEHSGKDNNAETGKACLGSDTDSVLSSVEGIDDNLMYNSGARNKRTEELSDLNNSDEVQLNRSGRTTGPLDNLNNAASDNSVSIPSYREEEAFGPISRNYEGDSNRFKRIRQIKQAPIPQEYSI